MSTSSRRGAATDIARAPLMLSSGRARHGWIIWSVLVLAALVGGAAAAHFYWMQQFEALQQQASATKELQPLRQALEQARLQLRVSDARGTELERQIDTLNQQLRGLQEEVTFFRKTRDAKRPAP
jgi:uncharacterized protein HemX